jgi:hypothetical protein
MDSQSAFLIFASLIGLVIVVVVLVAIFYKPAKKVNIQCRYLDSEADGSRRTLQVHLKNTGKKPLKIVAPYISFSTLRTSQSFQLKPEKIKIMFPRVMSVNEELKCDAEIGHYDEFLSKSNLKPSHVRVIVKDTEGLEFYSNSVDYKP